MGRIKTSAIATSPVVLALLLARCIGAEPSIQPYDGGTGDGSAHGGDGGHARDGGDATVADAKGDVISRDSAPAETGDGHAAHEAATDAVPDTATDAGVDAAPSCAATHDAGGAPGSLDTNFENGDKGNLPTPTPGAALIDSTGRVYVIGERTNCVSASSSVDFAISRFTASGSLDTSFGTAGTTCVDFLGGTDGAVAAAFDGPGLDANIVLVGFSVQAMTSPAASSFAIARVTSAGVLDTAFANGGTILTTPLATNGSCSLGAGLCSPPEAQQADAITFDASYSHFYVSGTTRSYPMAGEYDTAAFVASFHSDGTINTNFNTTGAAPHAKFGAPGYITDDGLLGFFDVAMDGDDVVVVGSDQGAPVDGGFAEKARQFVTRRYSPSGALDASFNAGGVTPGEIRTALGSNDYAESVRVDPMTGTLVVGGQVSVGGANTTADGYNSGYVGAVRYTASGVPDTSFGTGGIFVSDVVKGFPGYEHFILGTQCDGRVLLGGFIGDIFGGSAVNPYQTPALLRLTAAGQIDPTFQLYGGDAGIGDGGAGVAYVSFPGANVIVSGLMVDPTSQDTLTLSGDQHQYLIFERFLH